MTTQSAPQFISRTMPQCTIIPVLIYPDLANAITWFTNVLGFKERWRVGNHRAQLSFGEDVIAINGMTSVPPKAIPPTAGFKSHSLLVRVPDIGAHYEHAVKNGATIAHEPADFPYGERQYTVMDIGGHIWTFSQSIADLAPEDWGGTSAV